VSVVLVIALPPHLSTTRCSNRPPNTVRHHGLKDEEAEYGRDEYR
jgi:hypothetical protein